MILLKEIKSSYEIAMEKANEITEEVSPEEDTMEIREEIKPVLSRFYKNKIDADQLWEEFNGKNDKFLREAQKMILESLGLRTITEEYEKRKNGLLALESLKENSQSAPLERALKRIKKIQQKHQNDREQLEKQLENHLENNSQMQMKPIQTEDGRTVMKLEAGLDKETQERFNKAISETEAKYSKQFSWFIEDIKQKL